MSGSTATRMPVDAFLDMAARRGSDIAMEQPVGGGVLREYSWSSFEDEARRMASYLKSLNLPDKSNIGLISKNCAEWIIADLAILMAGHVSVPLYPTLTDVSVRQILEHCGAPVLFVGKLDDWEHMESGVPAGVKMIAFSLAPESAKQKNPEWSQIIAENSPLKDLPVRTPDELATIIYTSGTTGMPKGVMQSFGNLADIGGRMDKTYPISEGDRVISYFPLSHVAERAAIEMSMFNVGLKE